MQDIQIAVTFITAIAIIWLLAEFMSMKEKIKKGLDINNEGLRLKLQAYERLSVFAERSGLKSLASRVESSDHSAAMLHAAMISELKNEYDYNVSQQIYVTPEIWQAITKLRDQNIYVINQLASGLGAGASSRDLARLIIEYSMSPNAELNVIVLDALQYEAKKLLN